MLLSVNYHYVDMATEPYNGINSMSSSQLLAQVRWLQERFRFVAVEELLAQMDAGKWLDAPQCLITFDDGLKCHYECVFPILQKHNIPAAFFVSGQPLADRRGTEIHKSHVARARMGDTVVRKAFFAFIKRNGMDKGRFNAIEAEEVRAHYRYDPYPTAQFKYWTNYMLAANLRRAFWDDVILDLFQKEEDFCDEWYMNEAMICAMHQSAACVGSHAWSHNPLAPMDAVMAGDELKHSRELLSQITGSAIRVISYPLGNTNAVGKREGILAEELGYRLGFTMERAVNNEPKETTLLARVDCNDLPEVGKSPLFDWSESGLRRLDGSPMERSCELNIEVER